MDRNETIQAIRTALKSRSGKAWSVRGGSGTAYGWITISAPPARLGCARQCSMNYATDTCTRCGHIANFRTMEPCPAHECTERCMTSYMTPEDRTELATLLGLEYVHPQGQNVAASNAYYREFIARAAGLTPEVIARPYWD